MFNLELSGKIVLITGGSDGLGRATAERFFEEGANVLICGRRAEYAKLVAAKIYEDTVPLKYNDAGKILAFGADVTNENDCRALVNYAISEFGGIDILVNNAGVSAAFGLDELDEEAWLGDFNLKVLATVRLSRLVIPSMKLRGGGAIVNASIIGAKAPNAGSLPTSVMRAAGLNLTKSMAQEFASSGIRVNAICIGKIKSMQWVRRAKNGDPTEIYEEFSKLIPMGRVGEAEDYADLVAFLSSARASFITGTAVNLDGGSCPLL